MAQDVFITFFMIYLGLNNQQLFHLYFTPALWYFIIFSILDFRLLTLIWKMQYYPHEDENNNISFRKKIFCFHLKTYCMIIIGIFIIRYAVSHSNLMILLSFGMIPQIIQVATKQVNSKFDWYFSIIFINTRLLILLYHRGCPMNVEEFQPYVPQSVIFLVLIFCQIFILRYQSLNGSRSILPTFFLPNRYEYFVKYDADRLKQIQDSNTSIEYDDQICPICLEGVYSITHEHLIQRLERNPYYKQLSTKKCEYMRAPCGHTFHIVCLLNWMDVKLECPSCRCKLPPI